MVKNDKIVFSLAGILLIAGCLAFNMLNGTTFFAVRHLIAAAGSLLSFGALLLSPRAAVIPKSRVFYLYLASVAAIGLSVFSAVNVGESTFVYSKYVLTFLLAILFYNLFVVNEKAARKTLYAGCVVTLAVYLLVSCMQLSHVEDFSFGSLYKVTGLSGNKTFLTIMLFVLSSFALAYIAEAKRKSCKLLSVTLFAVSLALIVTLKSRAVMLSYAAAVAFFAVMFFVRKRKVSFSRKFKLWTTAAVFVVVILFFTAGLRLLVKVDVPKTADETTAEYAYHSTSSLYERFILWEKTYEMIDDHPFNGCGVGNWQVIFPDYGLSELYGANYWNINFTRPHNEFLGLLAECGHVTFFVCMLFVISLIMKSFFAICKTVDRHNFVYGAVILSAFVGCCVNSFFSFPSDKTEYFIWKAAMYAVLFTYITKDKNEYNSLKLNTLWKCVPVAVLVFTVFAGFLSYKGERNVAAAANAVRNNDWKTALRCYEEAVSVFYAVDNDGFPVNWHIGKAKEQLGLSGSLSDYRKAHDDMPFCKQNLNDLGAAEYACGNIETAVAYFEKAMQISSGFLYPYFNLSYIYLKNNDLDKAAAVISTMKMDENVKNILINDAVFFENENIEDTKKRIESEYQTTMKLRRTLNHLRGE
ncbi:MAG: O-antigen ligase family protein [Bacteroidales bacterium]|nr:O-antigen ligase family protein [Bacteroidales bacterium]